MRNEAPSFQAPPEVQKEVHKFSWIRDKIGRRTRGASRVFAASAVVLSGTSFEKQTFQPEIQPKAIIAQKRTPSHESQLVISPPLMTPTYPIGQTNTLPPERVFVAVPSAEPAAKKNSVEMQKQVDAIKVKGIQEEGPWYLLPGTGFNVRLQVDMLAQDLKKQQMTPEQRKQVVSQWLQQTEQDIQGFKIEYLCQGPLFPIVLDKKTIAGRERVIAPLYGDKLFVDTISTQERYGAVKRAIAGDLETGKKGVEDFLLFAPDGSVAVMTSPTGWSGMTGVTYQDSQTYIWQKQEGGAIRGFTVRTDMSEAQNRELLIRLGVSPDLLKGNDDRERLANIVGNVAFLSGNERKWKIEDVVEKIQQVKKSPYAFANRTFADINETLKNPQKLWQLDTTTQKAVDMFNDYVSNQGIEAGITDAIRQNIEIALGTTVLQLAEQIRTAKEVPQLRIQQQTAQEDMWAGKAYTVSYTRATPILASFDPLIALSALQRLPGCNGGGGASIGLTISYGQSVITNGGYPGMYMGGITPRLTVASSAETRILKCEQCPMCGARGKAGAKLEAKIENGIIHCPVNGCTAPYAC